MSNKRTYPAVLNKHGNNDRLLSDLPKVYIGRPSIWGNPFVIGKDGTRRDVVFKFKAWFMNQPELIARAKQELKGKDLVCFCAPLLCHGDVLIDIANESH